MRIFIAGFCAILSYILGGFTVALQALICFIVADYVVGVTVAAYLGKLSSKKGFKGILKKVLILALVAVAYLLDRVIFGHGYLLRDAVVLFYIANEVISILENIGKTNLPIPQKLKDAVEILKGGAKDENHR